MQEMARVLALEVSEDSYEPDVIVGLARGGWCPTRCVCDVLEQDDATSIKVEHYIGTATKGDGPTTRYGVDESAVEGKNVLLVDDIVDTGESVSHAADALKQSGAATVRTAVLHSLPDAGAEPDYVARSLNNFAWVIYPWNVVEDIHDITRKLSDREPTTYTYDELRSELEVAYGLDEAKLTTLPMPLETILNTLDERDELSFDGERVDVPE